LSRNSLSACRIFRTFKYMLETTMPMSICTGNTILYCLLVFVQSVFWWRWMEIF
jgi:hypothetical protein